MEGLEGIVEMPGINWLAVVVAAIAYMVLGAIWYAPPVFGNAWAKGIGKTVDQIKADFSPVNYAVALVTAFIAAYGVARLLLWTGGAGLTDGLIMGIFVGVCFVLTSFGVNDRMEGRPTGLTVGNVLYHLIGLGVVGIILGVWT